MADVALQGPHTGLLAVVVTFCGITQCLDLLLFIRDTGNQQSAGGVDLTFAQGQGRSAGQAEQGQAVVDVPARFAELGGDVVDCHASAGHELADAMSLVKRAEVLTLQVFNKLGFERFSVSHVADKCRDAGQAAEIAGTPAALSKNNFVCGQWLTLGSIFECVSQSAGGQRPHQDGRQNTPRLDVGGKLLHGGRFKVLAVAVAGNNRVASQVGKLRGGVHAVLHKRIWSAAIFRTVKR